MTILNEAAHTGTPDSESPRWVPVVRAPGGPSLHPLIANRRSPRSLGGDAIAPAVLERMLEAARWAPSSSNSQPWAFIVTHRDDEGPHAALADLLMGGNRVWAPQAPLLLVSMAQVTGADGKPRASAMYDLGLAVSQLVLQASAEGLMVHQMGGFDRERARDVLAIPEGWEPLAVIAIGVLGPPEALPDAMRAGETAPRMRKPLAEIAFNGRFGVPLR